jgi:diacylglycerol kinase family enzyme
MEALSRWGHQVKATATTGPGSASLQAREALTEGAEIVFACGGDGTVHEVLQGLVSEGGEPCAILGIIPLGSANALARHMRLPLDPIAAALQQLKGVLKSVPVGKITYGQRSRYFTVMAGAGADGVLAYKVLTSNKARLGRLAYYFHSARLYVSRPFPAFEVESTIAGSETMHRCQAASVIAVRVDDLGGLFSRLVGRDSSIHDRYLRLILISPPALLSLPLWFASGWLRSHSFNPLFRSLAVSAFACRPLSGKTTHVQADGEWLGNLPMEVSLVPNAIRILIPHAPENY